MNTELTIDDRFGPPSAEMEKFVDLMSAAWKRTRIAEEHAELANEAEGEIAEQATRIGLDVLELLDRTAERYPDRIPK
jgi:hypothetical protein